jgi:hypothetical protein
MSEEDEQQSANVVRLVPKEKFVPLTPTAEAMVSMLEKTIAQVKAGNVATLVVLIREPGGEVGVRLSYPLDEVQGIGMCRLGQLAIEGSMQRQR